MQNFHCQHRERFRHLSQQNRIFLGLLNCKYTHSVVIVKRNTRNKVQEFHILRNEYSLHRATKILLIRIQTTYCRNHLVYLWLNDCHRCLSAAAVTIDVVAATVFATVHVIGSESQSMLQPKTDKQTSEKLLCTKNCMPTSFFISSFQFT